MSDFWAVTLPSWLTGIGTLALASVTAWLAKREDSDRRRLQAAEQMRREVDRRHQASSVSAWYVRTDSTSDGITSFMSVANRSDEPVYRAVIFLVFVQGAGPGTGEEVSGMSRGPEQFWAVLSVVPPGV